MQHRDPSAEDTMTGLSPPAAVAGPTDDCPGCGTITGVQAMAAPPTVQAWTCAACGMQWAITVVNPQLRHSHVSDLAAAAEEIGRLRAALRQVCTLSGHASTLTDEQLRDGLIMFFESCAR